MSKRIIMYLQYFCLHERVSIMFRRSVACLLAVIICLLPTYALAASYDVNSWADLITATGSTPATDPVIINLNTDISKGVGADAVFTQNNITIIGNNYTINGFLQFKAADTDLTLDNVTIIGDNPGGAAVYFHDGSVYTNGTVTISGDCIISGVTNNTTDILTNGLVGADLTITVPSGATLELRIRSQKRDKIVRQWEIINHATSELSLIS